MELLQITAGIYRPKLIFTFKAGDSIEVCP